MRARAARADDFTIHADFARNINSEL